MQLQERDRNQDERPHSEAGEPHLEWKYGGMERACIFRYGGDDADEFAGFIKAMHHAVDAGHHRWGVIENRDFVEIANSGHILPQRITPQSGDIADHAKFDGCFVQSRMKVFHDKEAFAGGRNVLTEFLPLTFPGKIDLEVGLKITDVDDAQVLFKHHAAMGEGGLVAVRQTERQAADQELWAHAAYFSQAHGDGYAPCLTPPAK